MDLPEHVSINLQRVSSTDHRGYFKRLCMARHGPSCQNQAADRDECDERRIIDFEAHINEGTMLRFKVSFVSC